MASVLLPNLRTRCSGVSGFLGAQTVQAAPFNLTATEIMLKYFYLTLKIIGGLFGLLVLAVLVLPTYCDSTPRAKVAEAYLESTPAINALYEHCMRGTLVNGMTHEQLGLPDSLELSRYVQNIVVRVESPQRALIIITLGDITSDLSVIWSSLELPAGAILETEFQCNDGLPAVMPGKGTTVPVKYLPKSMPPPTQRI
jgi:hypothetical protein